LTAQTPAKDRRIVHVLAAAVIALNTVGNAALRLGLSSEAGVAAFSPVAYLVAFEKFWVILGVVLLIAWLILELALLSWADLTYVLPVTSLSYAFIALIGAFGLHERVSAVHWCGIALILAGVTIAGRTKPLTTEGGPGR
jgi:drug/metabolite transporter (DMT)-like permease